MEINKKILAENKEIYFINNKSMKSIIVWFMFYMPLNEFASENALVSSILLRGCEKHPTSREISKFLNSSYGSIVGTDINLKGEVYTLGVHLNFINPNLDFVKEDITENMLSFLNNIIYNPLTENNGFKKEYFESEKKNLLNQFEARLNDKDSYAFDKTVEVMCKDEAYAIDKLGNENSIKNLNNAKCFERYKNIVNECPLKVYVMGDIDEGSFLEKVNKIFKFKDANKLNVNINHKKVEKPQNVNETIDTNQGKLCFGFRTPIDLNSKDFPSLVVFNRLFGGGPEAKLFTTLREEESLCYTIYSTVEKHKGLVFVACGIDPKDKEKAINGVLSIFENIKSGNFTDEDLTTCIAAAKHSLKSVKDSKYTYIGYLQGLNIYNADYSLDDLCNSLENVTKDDVIKAANTLVLDTIYFLGRGEENEG